jgi:hypothetical protein
LILFAAKLGELPTVQFYIILLFFKNKVNGVSYVHKKKRKGYIDIKRVNDY